MVTIRRCSGSPAIRHRTQAVADSLRRDLRVQVDVINGRSGEFTVLVDGAPVLHRTGDTLPSIGEVEDVVLDAAQVTLGA
jgi:hypothetical protein